MPASASAATAPPSSGARAGKPPDSPAVSRARRELAEMPPPPPPPRKEFPAFPFAPYPIQSEFMSFLYGALSSGPGALALLESPTGQSPTATSSILPPSAPQSAKP